jgi:hypothetical protein
MTLDYTLRGARAQAPMAIAPFREWTFPDGALWAQFYRMGAGYLLRFPGLADFELSADTRVVSCHPTPGAAGDTAEHLYLNQVIPLVQSRQGRLVVHASAVEIDGGAVAFAAASGRGKSTLAASFSTSGFRFLTDDGLVLEPADGGFLVQPSHPSLRLWSDSHDTLVGEPAAVPRSECDGLKVRIAAGSHMAFCPQPRPLRRAFFLGDGTAGTFTCERMTATEALVAWVGHSFLLDLDEQALLAGHFDQVAAIANLPLSYRLDYPRRFEDLPRLRQAIVEHVREKGVAA